MTTIHASSPEDVVERAVTISLFGNVGFSEMSLQRMVVDALDVVIVLSRFADGTRKMTHIVEPYLDENKNAAFNELFVFDHEGYGPDGAPLGGWRWVNETRFSDRFRRMGIKLPEAALGELK